jgi:hypothetical protein
MLSIVMTFACTYVATNALKRSFFYCIHVRRLEIQIAYSFHKHTSHRQWKWGSWCDFKNCPKKGTHAHFWNMLKYVRSLYQETISFSGS